VNTYDKIPFAGILYMIEHSC